MFGKGHLFDLIMKSPFVTPTVMHFEGDHIPDHDVVCVGAGSCAVTLSPWSCPLTPKVYSEKEARRYINNRADATEWISRLSGKTLACNCGLPPDECWAYILVDKFTGAFADTLDDSYPQTFEVDDEDLDDERQQMGIDDQQLEDKTTGQNVDELISKWYRPGRDEIDAAASDVFSVPTQVPWPSSWIQLVQTIRRLQLRCSGKCLPGAPS